MNSQCLFHKRHDDGFFLSFGGNAQNKIWVYESTMNKYCRRRGSGTVIVTLTENCHHTFAHPAIDRDTRNKDDHTNNSYLTLCSRFRNIFSAINLSCVNVQRCWTVMMACVKADVSISNAVRHFWRILVFTAAVCWNKKNHSARRVENNTCQWSKRDSTLCSQVQYTSHSHIVPKSQWTKPFLLTFKAVVGHFGKYTFCFRFLTES